MIHLLLAVLTSQAPAPAALPTDAFESACLTGNLTLVKEGLDRNPDWVDARDDRGVSFLLNALHRRKTAVVEEFVKRRKTFDAYEAASLGDLETLRNETRRNPSLINAPSGEGFTTLHLAAFYAKPELVEFLIRAGANVAQIARRPRVMPLHSAIAGRCLVCARLLLQSGADANAPEDNGLRPLHAAAAANDLPLAELLISHRADPAVPADGGKTPIDVAREKGHHELAAWLTGASSSR